MKRFKTKPGFLGGCLILGGWDFFKAYDELEFGIWMNLAIAVAFLIPPVGFLILWG
jgi:hypothetical protein